ncbi:MAG: RNA 2'-phosphotransferase [Candidatus Thorarchaeota archaeon]|jgi:putative RNA 2'-phosphotransferase
MYNKDKDKKISKKLSYCLRHNPGQFGLTLDKQGWVSVFDLLKAFSLGRDRLEHIVKTNNKKRFEFNDKGTKIRARQGHSIEVDLGYESVEPPEILYHGTSIKSVQSILSTGINSGTRQHVHLSEDINTATIVGSRHGKVRILIVDSKRMHDDGLQFFKTNNNVWLADFVPPEYVKEK